MKLTFCTRLAVPRLPFTSYSSPFVTDDSLLLTSPHEHLQEESTFAQQRASANSRVIAALRMNVLNLKIEGEAVIRRTEVRQVFKIALDFDGQENHSSGSGTAEYSSGSIVSRKEQQGKLRKHNSIFSKALDF